MKKDSKIIVIDTSVFVSALISSEGGSREILRHCLKQEYEPIMGTTLYCEYESLLHRREVVDKCPLSKKEREQLLDAFCGVCRWVGIYFLWRPNLRDEADNHVVELAVAGGANRIVTHNIRDFKNSQLLFPGILVKTPKQFLQEE